MSKYILLDDNAIKIGGTNLSIMSMISDREKDFSHISTSDLQDIDIAQHIDKIWIIGNIMNLAQRTDNIVEKLFNSITKFVKIEFDYNFCPFRGEVPHLKLGNTHCDCPYGKTGVSILAEIYDHIIKKSKHIFFMSERQRAIYIKHMPLIDVSKTSILSSCFSQKYLDLFSNLRSQPKNSKYAILKGFGGWHSEAKGVAYAKNFCEVNNLEYEILPIQDYEDHIDTLSKYKGIVFLPIIDDTCPRCIIEAKLLGLEVITNINCQHVTEWWWKDETKTLDYMKSRPNYFWSTLDTVS